MQLITKSVLIDTVAERVRLTYQSRGRWLPMTNGRDPQQVVARLEALPKDAEESEITAIVGDDRFTVLICDECGADVPVAVRMGFEVHHPIDERQICTACLDQAQTLAQSQT